MDFFVYMGLYPYKVHLSYMSRSKYWCFTINNYSDEEYDSILLAFDIQENRISYIIFGIEVGEQKTQHLQGYVEFTDRPRLHQVKQRINERGHYERRRGTSEEASVYCKKDDRFFEFGTISKPRQGRRADLEEIKQKISSGTPVREVAEEHFALWCQYRRSFDAYHAYLHEPRFRQDLRVYCLWGAAGTGKTRFAYEFAAERGLACWLSSDPELRWFDGYSQQPIAILDDYRGDAPVSLLLRILDIYPTSVAVKGGFVPWNPIEIWVTSNTEPSEWYQIVDVHAAIRRRFARVVHFVGYATGDWESEYERIKLNF